MSVGWSERTLSRAAPTMPPVWGPLDRTPHSIPVHIPASVLLQLTRMSVHVNMFYNILIK